MTAYYSRRVAFTIVELLVVVVIVMVLMGLLLVAVGGVRLPSRQLEAGNNLKQLYTSLLVQRGQSGSWPLPVLLDKQELAQGNGKALMKQSMAVTAAIFERLHEIDRVDIRYQLFIDPVVGSQGSADIHQPNTIKIKNFGTLHSQVQLDYARAYAFDWSAPLGAGAARVVMALRDPNQWQYLKTVMVYGDGSMEIEAVRSQVQLADDKNFSITLNGQGQPLQGHPEGMFINPSMAMVDSGGTVRPDVIYDNAYDDSDGLLLGLGSVSRCFVK